jgi:coenzyme F420-reducing hydrogenase beta subunit
VDRVEDISKLQGSKYVQSNINGCYKQIKQHLTDGRTVLFSGTPCQCAGLKAFLRKPYENLFIIDIICHGVPNQKLLNDYLEYKHTRKGKITNFAFRDKSKGWGLLGRVDYENGKSQTIPAGLSSFYSFFLDSQIYRENCYKCKYASQNRPGDLTLGDYWGIEREHPELIASKRYNPKDGISCIITNTPKGADLLQYISDSIIMDSSTYEKIANRNKQLLQPSNRGKYYDEIFNAYRKSGYKAVDKIFYRHYKKQILIHSIFSKLPFGLKERIRKVLK